MRRFASHPPRARLAAVAFLAAAALVPAGAADPTHPHLWEVSPLPPARLPYPEQAVLAQRDGRACLAVTDSEAHRVFAVFLGDGSLEALAGGGEGGDDEAADSGLALGAILDTPKGIAVDVRGNLIVADSRHCRVVKITPEGRLERFAGSGTWGASRVLDERGHFLPGPEVAMGRPFGATVLPDGETLVSDSANGRILAIGTDGRARLAAARERDADEPKDVPELRLRNAGIAPTGMALRPDGHLFVSASEPGAVCRIDPQGAVAPLKGQGRMGEAGASFTFTPAAGARYPKLGYVDSLCVDPDGVLYLIDYDQDKLFRIAPDGGTGWVRFPGQVHGLLSVNAVGTGALVVTTSEGRMSMTFPGCDDGHPSGDRLELWTRKAIQAGLAGQKEVKAYWVKAIGRGCKMDKSRVGFRST
jgi:sugar lactone lactonase YvrE